MRTVEMKATDLFVDTHPLHAAFVRWLGNREMTKRQARKFLQAYPQYREVKSA